MQSTLDQRTLTRQIGFDPDYLKEFEAKVFIEGAQTRRRLTNFFVLLLLATVIATYGVLSNSTATVIGAMIVAPLMGPIIATTAAAVMGSAPRAGRALALTVVGALAVILFSTLLTLAAPDSTISFTKNGEIASRISPGLYALLTALGAGAAGAYITSRAEIADSMGGVAIAISLVPPLCVVGISLSQRNWPAAWGSLLLFLTNFLAILLAGGLVFMLNGLGRLAMTEAQVRLRRRSFILIVFCTLLVAIPLSLTAYQTVANTLAKNRATTVVQSWLETTLYRVVTIDVHDQAVTVTIEGSGDLNPRKDLAAALKTALGQPVIVTLHIIPTQIEVIEGN